MSREKMTVLSPTELLGDRLAEEPLPSDSLGSEGEKSRRLAETATSRQWHHPNASVDALHELSLPRALWGQHLSRPLPPAVSLPPERGLRGRPRGFPPCPCDLATLWEGLYLGERGAGWGHQGPGGQCPGKEQLTEHQTRRLRSVRMPQRDERGSVCFQTPVRPRALPTTEPLRLLCRCGLR